MALDLIAVAVGTELREERFATSSPRTVALLRLKAVIEEQLRNAALRPATAAAAAGISVRYANALLADEDTSLERYIIERRLHNCRRELVLPGSPDRTIGEIAFAWGFSNSSHFARRFKEYFGYSPRECRRWVSAQ